MAGIMRSAMSRLRGPEAGRRFLSMSETRRHNPADEDRKSSKAEIQAEKLRYVFILTKCVNIVYIRKSYDDCL
jgi:hypothetical protein